jgi:hypothetical protein
MLDRLTEDILAYAMQGDFPEQELARSLKPEQLDERFEEYQLLRDLHFVLKQDVVDFVRELPGRLRSIRTETESVSRTSRGAVEGRINWGATVKTRYSRNPTDRSLFVCDNRSIDYDIPENLVLKRLVAVIYDTLQQAEHYLKSDYEWARETWRGEEQLIDDLQRIVERNVHVRRIRDPETYEPTERMLTAAANSRQAIYREAAELVRSRQRLIDNDPDELRRLLDQTAITPDDENTLFELYVLFRFIGTLEEMRDEQVTFKTISSERQEIARIEGEKEIVLYHDNSASDRNLSFVPEPDPDKDDLSRTEEVQVTANEVAGNYFRRDFENYTGRPDVIVIEIRDPETDDREFLIAEVKNSTSTDTIRRGIKETLEYLAFLRVNEQFVFGRTDGYFGSGWNGLLVVQDIDEETAPLTDQWESEIKILQASEVEDQLELVLDKIL